MPKEDIQSDNVCQLIQLGIIEKIDCVIWIDGLNDYASSIPLKCINIDYDEIAISGKSIKDIPLVGKNWNDQRELANHRLATYLNYRKRITKLLDKLEITTLNVCQPICDYLNSEIPSFTKGLVKYGVKAYEMNYRYGSWCKNIENYAQSMFDLEYIVFNADEVKRLEYADFCH